MVMHSLLYVKIHRSNEISKILGIVVDSPKEETKQDLGLQILS
jgi:hypothetical protein